MNIFKNIALTLVISSAGSISLANAIQKKPNWLELKEYVTEEPSAEFSVTPQEYPAYIAVLFFNSRYDTLENFLNTDRISAANQLKAKCDLLKLLRTLPFEELCSILEKQHKTPTVKQILQMVIKEKFLLEKRLRPRL